MNVQILCGDSRELLKTLPAKSVQCCVTSPPYFGLRDYGTATWDGGDALCDHKHGRFERPGLSAKQASNRGSGGDEARRECPKCGAKRIDHQIGLEAQPDCGRYRQPLPIPMDAIALLLEHGVPDEVIARVQAINAAAYEPCGQCYVCTLVLLFREVRRVLRDDGTVWLNLGDSYAADRSYQVPSTKGGPKHAPAQGYDGSGRKVPTGLKPKDLIMIPARVALALQADGWYLRQEIIWAKGRDGDLDGIGPGNSMPESVKDRPSRSHEQVYLLAKSPRYFYDAEAIKEKSTTNDVRRPYTSEGAWQMDGRPLEQRHGGKPRNAPDAGTSRNARSVWLINTSAYKDAHYAVMPEKLAERCILAGTSPTACGTCGAPYTRIIDREKHPLRDMEAQRRESAASPGRTDGAVPGPGGMVDKTTTVGWTPTCQHDDPTGQCTVLDMFGGAGTTAKMALKHGRGVVLIELNPANLALIEKRIGGIQTSFTSFLD